MRELARVDDRPLQPLDGRREAPDRKRMIIRSPDGAARSVRAIDKAHRVPDLSAIRWSRLLGVNPHLLRPSDLSTRNRKAEIVVQSHAVSSSSKSSCVST